MVHPAPHMFYQQQLCPDHLQMTVALVTFVLIVGMDIIMVHESFHNLGYLLPPILMQLTLIPFLRFASIKYNIFKGG